MIADSLLWQIVQLESPFTRTSLFEQKYSDYAYLLGADGKSFRYSHGKIAPSSTFPLADFALVLNEVERSLGTAITLSGESVDAEINAWGGDDMTGGSPRGTGSALPPHDYVHLRNAFSSYTGAGRGKYDPVKLPLFIREELPKLVVR